jgi:signal transduction histidine kinase
VELAADAAANPEGRDVRTLMFESARELLFNVVKHAKVLRAVVDLSLTPTDAVRLSISDAGAGFDSSASPAEGSHDDGLGLASIHERVTLVGGLMAKAQGSRSWSPAPATLSAVWRCRSRPGQSHRWRQPARTTGRRRAAASEC